MTSIIIAGGVYPEQCDEPHWYQIYGSGGRAAAAISRMNRGVCLHTYVSARTKLAAEALATTFGFRLTPHHAKSVPAFHYQHALSPPTIWPGRESLGGAAPIEIQAEAVLRFGFLEGDARVDADRVVYDPQSPQHPQRFDANGSRARRLAIVLNRAEGSALTGETDPRRIARKLMREHGAATAVVKLGPSGVFVAEGSRQARVPAFMTNSVFPIGSGDVFSAVFAHY